MTVFTWVLLVCLFMANPAAAQGRVMLLRVPDHYATIQGAIDAAPAGATIDVAPGEYAETLTINRPLVLRGGVGEVIVTGTEDAPVLTITDTQHVIVRGLTLQGGENGILVWRSQDVVIRGNVIRDNRLVGIKVRMGEASIIGNTIQDTQPPYGRGIHITNTMDWPTSIIRGNTITGNAMSGIITNMAMVRVSGNIVTDNGDRGIAITEMSEAVVADNQVEDNMQIGIYISDQSTAIICNNIISTSQLPTIEDAARYGNGITVDYGAQAELHNNVVVGNANYGVGVLDSSRVALSDNIFRQNGADTVWLDDTSDQQRLLDLPQSCE